MKLIVGLGNPGRIYADNRHNLGFQCLNTFARRHGISLDRVKARSRVGAGEVAGERVVLARPRTFMNLSGEAVAALLPAFSASPHDLVVIHDDLDLPLGMIRIRERGGSGGHNGVKSIISSLGSQDFARIRVGIAPAGDAEAEQKAEAIEYVLGDFTPEERPRLKEVCARAADALYCLLEEGITAAMNRYNRPHPATEE